MTRNHNLSVLITICIILILFFCYNVQSFKTIKTNTEYSYGPAITSFNNRYFPIFINGNNDLVESNSWMNGIVGGYGTPQDPYIISGWKIDCIKILWNIIDKQASIEIRNVDKYIVIENNYLYNAFSLFDEFWNEGIRIEDCSNIIIRNNYNYDCSLGISIVDSKNCQIESNIISANQIGIGCSGIDSNNLLSIKNNQVNNNNDGIRCVNSNAVVMENDISSNNDGVITWEDTSHILNNNIFNNIESGIVCLNSEAVIESNNIYDNLKWGVYINGDPSPSINRNMVTNCYDSGIYLAKGEPKIENNTINYNVNYGIFCGDGEPQISHNLIEFNLIGIRPTRNTIISFNNIFDNTVAGIDAGGSNPIVNYNNIVGNTYGLKRNGMMPWVDALNNWWGSADGPSGYGPGTGDPITYQALYAPWLTQPSPIAGPI
jgi:parallel beta-helix repeat protein